jgi:predicted metal-dependent hydrolase
MARDRLVAASEHYADLLGRPFGKVSLRDTRSRWGSCTSEGNLMYSWRLILAPVDVLNYVAAHEVSHLAEMNHSQAFWSEVERLMPGYAAPRKWLKQHGAELHRFQFTN